MALFRVMQRMETGEECCAVNDLSREAADLWIVDNYTNYPESVFWVEAQESPLDWSDHPDYEDGEFVD